LTLRHWGRAELKSSLTKCLNILDRDLKAISYFPFLDQLDGVAGYLKANSFGLKERLRIQSQFSQKKKVRAEKTLVIENLKLILEGKNLDTSFKRSKMLKAVKRIKSRFWQRIIEFPIALEANNKVWLSRLKKSLCQESPYYHDVRGWDFSTEEVLLVRDYFLNILKQYSDKYGEDEELKILAEKLSLYGKSNEFKTIRSRFDSDWSLSEIRENFKNPYLRNKYFDFWFLVLMNRTSDMELDQRIRESLSQKVLTKALDSQFWVFEYFFPADSDLRAIIYKRFDSQWRGRDRIHRFQVLRSLSRSAIKKGLAKRNPEFNRAIFQIKRQYFSELLLSGEATHFAFYQLAKLGDRDSDNLWWLMY